MPFIKSEDTFCARDRYTKSLTATSSIQCQKIIKIVVLSEKLTNTDRPKNVARDEETGGIQPISMASCTDNLFFILPLCSNYFKFL